MDMDMAAGNKPGYSPVPGDGGRACRRNTVEEEGGYGFLDLSLGSIYNTAAAVPVDASSAVSTVLAAGTAAYAPLVSANNRTSAFALGLDASAVSGDDGNGGGGGHVFVLAANAVAAANQDLVVPAPAPSVLPTALFARGDIVPVPVPVPVPVHGNGNSSATLLGASPPPSSTPAPPNRKAPRGRRGRNATAGRRRRSGAAGDDADAAPPTNGGESTPPFPWSTKTAGTHLTLAELIQRGIASVEGEVRCKRCDAGKTISYEIRAKFEELSAFIVSNMEAMHDRAPPEWMYPVLPDCDKCGQKNSLRPVIAAEKWRINWLFLLLGQTLGLCTLEQLKHFCARTRQHRTGAKDRVLYSTYMELCNQLCPGGPFDMASERKNRTRPFA